MRSRRASRAPDLERVRQVLDPSGAARAARPDEPAARPETGRWVPSAPRPLAAAQTTTGSPADDLTDLEDLDRLDADLRRARRPALLTVPEQLRRGRRAVSSPAVVALLALVVGLGCVFALRVLWAERTAGSAVTAPSGEASTSAPRLVVSGPGPAKKSAALGPTGVSPTAAGEVVVHVVGEVGRPGLVRLRKGARVADAIAAAGGAQPGADLPALNLARLVVDGEQVHVTRPGEVVSAPPLGVPPGSVGPSGSSASASAVIDLNGADAAALDSLPGVGPVLAQRIVDWRTEHGRFSSVDELGEVSGIGDKLMSQLRPRVRV